MTNKELVLDTLKQYGKLVAESIQAKAPEMSGTELNAESDYIPEFRKAVENKNMMERTAGQKDGFVCKSSAGRVVRLIQNYDSRNYLHEDGTPLEPEELHAQWRFVWSKDPKKALPFIALATSPYDTGDCCTEKGIVHRSKFDGNIHAPSAWPEGWELVTE